MEKYLKRYVEVIYENFEGKEKRFEGCLYAHSEDFIFMGGKMCRMPIRKDQIKQITILRPENEN